MATHQRWPELGLIWVGVEGQRLGIMQHKNGPFDQLIKQIMDCPSYVTMQASLTIYVVQKSRRGNFEYLFNRHSAPPLLQGGIRGVTANGVQEQLHVQVHLRELDWSG